MPKINILSESMINKIAAGEVVERPASIVKELIENSLDAGADEIKIEIEDAGKKKIKVADNGEGMDEEDAILSWKRHATSKIKDENDLFHIDSLGFRGEALASIAEISNMTIATRKESSLHGTSIEIEAGKLLRKEIIGMNFGTSIEVNNIFFNVPARKKFLKSDEIELGHIVNIVQKYALIRNDVSIKLINNGKEIINSPKTESMLNNISFIYGTDIAKNLLEVNHNNNGMIIKGYVSRPSLTRMDKSDQSLYVNGRFVKDNIVSDSVYNAYHTLLFINRHPIFVLNITIDSSQIDVNVHPSKTAIKFKHENIIEKEVFDAIRKVFEKNSLIADATLESEASHMPVKKYLFSTEKQSVLAVKEESLEYNKNEIIGEKKERAFGPFYILGQINKTYIIAENPDGLAIIDQHAAEERVNYEAFMRQLKDKAIKKQNLMQSKVIQLNPTQYQIAKNNKEFLNKVGFIFDDFGNNSLKLSAIPEIFGRLKSTILIDILNELGKEKSSIVEIDIEERIIRFACRASVKAGEEMTKPEMEKLLNDLEKTSNPYSCPHGRPTVINLSISELERKFKRVGW